MVARDRLLTRHEIRNAAYSTPAGDPDLTWAAVSDAQDAKTLKALTEWLDDACPHGTKVADTSHASRRECDICWEGLLAELDAQGKGKEG